MLQTFYMDPSTVHGLRSKIHSINVDQRATRIYCLIRCNLVGPSLFSSQSKPLSVVLLKLPEALVDLLVQGFELGPAAPVEDQGVS